MGYWRQVPGPWTDYTPTLTQSGAVTKTVTRAKYIQLGKTVHVNVYLTITGTGTANNVVLVGLPVASVADGITIGAGRIYDASGPDLLYRSVMCLASTTTVRFEGGNTTLANGLGGSGQPFSAALASGDIVEFTGTYEVA